MTSDNYILITGANGEVGHGLIDKLQESRRSQKKKIIAFDLSGLDPKLQEKVDINLKGDVTDEQLINEVINKYNIDTLFHLAAILSTSAEKNPDLAHKVNVNGTFNLLSSAYKKAEEDKRVIKFIFPSSIAVYGIPDMDTKKLHPKVHENEFLNPITIYGVSKLYCEQLGAYYSDNYSQLLSQKHYLDFRCLRFPGLISAQTVPTGGTSDYAPEMLHAAAQGKSYECFVREDSVIHFMAMPDAIDALLMLTYAKKDKLNSRVYNIRGFSASAKQIEEIVKRHFPKANISYKVNPERQKIIDSWSEDVDDSNAVKDWGWKAKYDFKKAFEQYLIPSIKNKYADLR